MGRPAGRRYVRRSTPRSGIDGYDALRLIRERAPDIPVIALTAYAFETDRQRMFQAGFNECLAKPLRADELRSRIASLLSR